MMNIKNVLLSTFYVMKTKNVLLGLALGAFVLFSCAKKSRDISPDAKSDIGKQQRTKVESIIYRLKNASARAETFDQAYKEFQQLSNEEYDIYFEIGKEEAIRNGVSSEEIQIKQDELNEAIALSMEMFQKYPQALNEEEWKIYDPALTKKRNQQKTTQHKEIQKAACQTQSFPYQTSVGGVYNRTSSSVNLVNAQGQNDCDYEYKVWTSYDGVRNTFGTNMMRAILQTNGGKLNYREAGEYSFFLIGKNRVDLAYVWGIFSSVSDFHVQTVYSK
jgi:hypothetical protein